MLAKVRIVLWALVALAAVSATVIFFTRPITPSGSMFGGPFEMVSTASGESFTQDDLVGAPTLMFFGYTFCPDVCPTTLAEAASWKETLGLDDDELRIVFVSVDPERDTLDHVRGYLSNFGAGVMGLVGDESQTEQIKRSYGIYSEKVEAQGTTEYLVNHTASVFMIDDEGNFFGTIAWGENMQTALDKVRRLTKA